VLIGTSAAAPESDVTEGNFAALANRYGSAFFCDLAINQQKYVDLARKSGAEVAISVNWKTLIHDAMLGVFEHGIINAHTGDLPRYRGNATPNWAILNGESKIVLTLHRMVEELDAGPILAQASLAIGDDTYIADVYAFEDDAVPKLFVEVVDGLVAGTLTPRAQDSTGALRCYPRLARDNHIEWSLPAIQIARLVRAMSRPFDGAYTYLGSQRLIVWRARAEAGEFIASPGQVAERQADGSVRVCSGDGFVVLEELEVVDDVQETPAELRNKSAPTEVIRSLRTRLGLDAEAEIRELRAQVENLSAELEKLR
jgi:methionyl-tRNA formyltransferase